MKKALTFQLFFLMLTLCHAQAPNFFADSARWVYYTHTDSEPGDAWSSSSYSQNIILGDTAISGIMYKTIYSNWHRIVEVFNPLNILHYYGTFGPTYLRYDSTLKHVYYLPGLDSTERLIYDFDLQVGDTTPMQPEYFMTTVIHSIDTVLIFGDVPVKRFFLAEVGQTELDERNYILEGIGGSNGLFNYQPAATLVSGGIPMTGIECFQFQDNVYTPYGGGDCPFIDFISATHPVSEDYSLTVSPNPTQGALKVTIDEPLLGTTYTIVDNLGRLVQSFKLSELQTTFHLKTPGIYFWRVEHHGQIIKTGKVVCH